MKTRYINLCMTLVMIVLLACSGSAGDGRGLVEEGALFDETSKTYKIKMSMVSDGATSIYVPFSAFNVESDQLDAVLLDVKKNGQSFVKKLLVADYYYAEENVIAFKFSPVEDSDEMVFELYQDEAVESPIIYEGVLSETEDTYAIISVPEEGSEESLEGGSDCVDCEDTEDTTGEEVEGSESTSVDDENPLMI